MTDDCQHHMRIRTSNGKQPWYKCVQCGFRWSSNQNGKVPGAPQDWERMSLADLRLWYAREVLGAVI